MVLQSVLENSWFHYFSKHEYQGLKYFINLYYPPPTPSQSRKNVSAFHHPNWTISNLTTLWLTGQHFIKVKYVLKKSFSRFFDVWYLYISKECNYKTLLWRLGFCRTYSNHYKIYKIGGRTQLLCNVLVPFDNFDQLLD